MAKKSSYLLLASMLSTVALSGCGGQGNEGKGTAQDVQDKKKEPYTMTIFTRGVSADEFDDRFRKAIEKKFPHITFKYIMAGTGTQITDLVSQGTIPDIMRIDVPSMNTEYIDVGLAYGLGDLIKKYNYNLKRFNSVFIDEMISAGRTGELYGLPVPPYFPMALYYNKELFDRFGVPYPKDGMTWDEVYEIAKKMTRVDGEVYRGFSSSTNAMLRDNPFSLPILDPAADKLADPGKWTQIFNNYLRFYQIPNNVMEKTATLEGNAFGKGKVAMMAGQQNIYFIIPPEVNWDMVAYPTITGAPKLMGQRGPAYWSITKQSQHKEEAFEVIMEMLSDEIQMEDSKKGIATTLVNPDIKKMLGKSHPVFSTKNMNAVNFYEPTSPTPKRKPELVDIPGRTQEAAILEAFTSVVTNQADVNSALRMAEEKLKKAIDAEKAAKK
ncbi:hypothetical protein PAESOLCIP111_00088 [Paenibacillus solanacearum]|uniref:Extracellular solute-binding protein n=1 Tax=Paenibacillus solanacearum TaxID=2048548 RepID=A0A916NKV8_9BACL|nr:extracellular solute-binding protein [Paenibacillus solanacearum]CAG7596557.1 hypothetical protein PAESOLCIP111_00088 [Paenibacillus solanacearum]